MTEQPTTPAEPDRRITAEQITAGGIDFMNVAAPTRLVGSSEELALKAVEIMDRPYVSALDLAKAQVFATLSVRGAVIETAGGQTDDLTEAMMALQGIATQKPAEDIAAEAGKKRPARKKAE